MIRPTRAAVFGAAIALLGVGTQLAVAHHASAQWLPDRNYTEGPGIRVGDLELHPGVAVRGGYDTNVFRTPGTAANPELGSAVLAVSPHLNLTTLSKQRMAQGESAAGANGLLLPPVVFRMGVSATYLHFFRENAPKNVDADFDGALSILPERRVGFDLGAQYVRATRPFTAPVAGERNAFRHNRIRPSLMLRGQSRGGVLNGSIGVAPTFILYESDVFRYLSQHQYELPGRLAWKFLPNTALLFDGVVGLNDYTKLDGEHAARAAVLLSDSKRFQSRMGVNGAISANIAARVLVGYAVIAIDNNLLDDREDVVGEAALTYAWSPKDNLELGFMRTVDVSNLGGWMQLDRGYFKSQMGFLGAFALNLEAGVANVNYGRQLRPDGSALGTNGTTERDDIRIDGGVHAEYRATNWLAFMADFTAMKTFTDFEFQRGSTATPIPYPGEFRTYQIFGGVRAHY